MGPPLVLLLVSASCKPGAVPCGINIFRSGRCTMARHVGALGRRGCAAHPFWLLAGRGAFRAKAAELPREFQTYDRESVAPQLLTLVIGVRLVDALALLGMGNPERLKKRP